ncbi:carbohydrate ABC transporter permease [Lachnoclostridium sp. Marseille-P6806]|uniref:carbohydrate ABC transporter permease n=1 Tax=Lachnoclostridium sp. Marseille-P6806 TaxID=2364793 RepID=UPI0010316610|nr:sugar ABC transporter permease [Lachnoclostridium sp. Marseille-P6806]
MNRKKGLTLQKKKLLTGWFFVIPATAFIFLFSFYPMLQAFILSLHRGVGQNLSWNGFANYTRILKDRVFFQTMRNTFVYLIIQVPIMLLLALILASVLNNRSLRFRGLFRTMIFLPCATSLVSYSMIFRSMFANDGFVNTMLRGVGMAPVGWFQSGTAARAVIIIALVWRWTGYNMVFYLAGMQSIDYALYESAKIDGASVFASFRHITVPLLRPTILMTAIMSISGTLQLFDESVNLTNGGPGRETMTMSHYIYNTSFVQSPNFSYAAAVSVVILVMIAVLSFIQMKVGDKRD